MPSQAVSFYCKADALAAGMSCDSISMWSQTQNVWLQDTAELIAIGKTDPFEGSIEFNACTWVTLDPLSFLDPAAVINEGVCEP